MNSRDIIVKLCEGEEVLVFVFETLMNLELRKRLILSPTWEGHLTIK